MSQKYKITEQILDTKGGIAKLEKDGFTRQDIHNQMYKVTHGASTNDRRELMQKLYKRSQPC